MHTLFNRFRGSIHPPYTKKTYTTLAVTILIIIIVPLWIVFSRQQTNRSSYAASLVPTEVAGAETGVAIGRQLFPPKAALSAKGMPGIPGEKHGLGLVGPSPHPLPSEVPSITLPPQAVSTAHVQGASTTSLATSVDLSQYAVPVGNQGGVNSCVAWAEDYTQRGWYAERDGYYPTGGSNNLGNFAPMYTYAQIVKGQNIGTTFASSYTIMQTQGVDTNPDYFQGNYDYTDQPTTAEHTNAANYKISSYPSITVSQASIQTALAGGDPVTIGLPVYTNFYYATPTNYFVDVPTAGMTFYGNHAVVAIKYDQNGLWIENSWGTYWGLNGWVELSWAFVNQYVFAAYKMTPINPSSLPSLTPVLSSTPTQAPTTTPGVTNTPVPSATPTPTPTLLPSPTPTITPSATPTVTPHLQDTIPPTISFTYPTNGALVSRNAAITMTVTATDDTAITNVQFLVNGVVACTNTAIDPGTTSSYSCLWTTTGKPGANYTLKAVATDTGALTSSVTENVVSSKR